MRTGSVFRWSAAIGGGYRTQAISNGLTFEFAMNLSVGEKSLIVWFADDFHSSVPCFFLNGREILPSKILELYDLELEIEKLRSDVRKVGMEHIEGVAAEVMVDLALEKRNRIIDGSE